MKFSEGMKVTWMRQPQGGYGYIESVPARVVGFTKSRVVIAAMLKNGAEKVVRVNSINLRAPGA